MTNARMRTVAGLTLGAAVLAGCVSSIDGPQSPAFGEGLASVRAQAVTAAVSPQPPETSGQAAAAAVDRYARGETKPIEVYSTSVLSGMTSSQPEK